MCGSRLSRQKRSGIDMVKLTLEIKRDSLDSWVEVQTTECLEMNVDERSRALVDIAVTRFDAFAFRVTGEPV